MKVHSFPRGGFIYQDEHAPSYPRSRIAFLPTIAVIPMLQHAGPSAAPVVAVGSSVGEGMVVGRSGGNVPYVVHSSIPGKVVKSVVWRMPDGREATSLVVKLEGSFEKLGKRREVFSWNGMSPSDLQRTLSEKGLVEMDGSGRSISELLAEARNSDKKSLLVLNAVFDDPWLAAERVVLCERAEQIAEGAEIALKISGASSLVIAVAKEHLSLVSPVVDYLASRGFQTPVAVLSSRYPQRNRRELEIAVGSFARASGLEFQNSVCLGMSSLSAIHDAVRLNLPLVERYVAVGGDAVKRPAVLRVRIGTRIGDAFAECGGFVDDPERVVIGSPLTGSAVCDLDAPITKTTWAVAALSARRIGGNTVRNCIGCGNCRAVCPVSLDPERLHKLVLLGRYAEAAAENAAECHGCGCCAAVCPSRLPLRSSIMYGARRGVCNE